MSISQNLPSTRPTLNLNFARSKTLDPRITFTRSSSATYVDKDGIIKRSVVNHPRFDHNPVTGESLGLLVEEQRTNLITTSEILNPTYGGVFGISELNAEIAPNNTFTATKITQASSGGWASPGAGTFTYSIFVKQGTSPTLSLIYAGYGGTDWSFTFATESLSVAGVWSNASVQKFPNGWYRLSATTNSRSLYYFLFSTSSSTTNAFIWGLQVESGSFSTSYIPTVPTFTSRASTATFYDSTGTLRTAASNVARSDAYFPDSSNVFRSGGLLLEGAATNLFANSSFIQKTDISFPDNWDGWNPATFLKSQTVAPDGISYGIFHGAINQNGGGLKRDFTGLSASTTYVVSFWARSITSSELTYFTNNNGRGTTTGTADGAANVAWFAATQARFDIQNINGTGGSGAAQFVLSTTWRRFSGSITTDSAGSIRIIISNNVGDTGTGNEDGGGVWMIWGAQLEQATNGITATSYIPTVPSFTSRASSATYYDVNGILRTAAINEARNNAYIPESSTVFRGPNWLVENAATNLLTYSEQFDNVIWGKSNSTVSANATIAPDGTLTADKWTPDNLTGDPRLGRQETRPDGTYTLSFYAKSAGFTQFRTHMLGRNPTLGSIETRVLWDLTAVSYTIETGSGSASIQNIGNGWFRCVLTYVKSGTSTDLEVRPMGATATGDGTSGVFIWGAQLETGSRATSYIQTVDTTATRAADVISYPTATRAADVFSSPSVTRSADTVTISGSNFSSFYNQSEGTFLWEGKFNITRDDNDAMFSVNNGSVGEQRFSIRRGNTLATTTGSNFINGINTGLTTNLGRVAFAYKSGSYAIVTNGTINSQPTSTQVPTPDRITQFNAYEGDVVRNSIHHRRLVYYPFRLSNSQLQAITK